MYCTTCTTYLRLGAARGVQAREWHADWSTMVLACLCCEYDGDMCPAEFACGDPPAFGSGRDGGFEREQILLETFEGFQFDFDFGRFGRQFGDGDAMLAGE
ncbi:MAG: hypothetical protein EBZ50_02255 [Alphaproteobacteria bacterium]|nr:hypothetical protein [Alphaproteobacteria bacterium]